MKKKNNDRLRLWQDRLTRNETAYANMLEQMDGREKLYRGDRSLKPFVRGVNPKSQAQHVRNIIAENIESIVDSSIPQPKVTPRRLEDEWRADLIEAMIRNELDRLRTEELNDMQERTVPIQGGSFWLVEWDEDAVSHGISGEVALSVLHPKQVIPQDGVTSSIEDMDYIIVKLPQTKDYIRRRYGVDVDAEVECEPEIRALDCDAAEADEMVTQYVAYYRSESGGIGLYSWVNDTELEDLEDYQARRNRRCASCGALGPVNGTAWADMAREERRQPYGEQPAGEAARTEAEEERETADVCPYCGGDVWEETMDSFEEVYLPITSAHNTQIPGASWGLSEEGEPVLRPTRIPLYKPNCYPVVLQRNISLYGQLLGDSDVDKIADFQNAINWLNQKIDRRLMEAGTVITGPAKSSFTVDPDDNRLLRLDSPGDKAMIDTYEFTGDISPQFTQLSQCYEAARQALGVTDSFQGRRDTTATSGRAKEFAAAQSAGRLESKRRMKDAAWAKIFELIFKFRLAYADEPRPVISQGINGDRKYDKFDRYDFLMQDPETGEWWWNDQFLFSCDTSAPLASNRETMWQEARMNFTSGAYGDPAQATTQILFWSEMERLHYPLAGAAKKYIEELWQQQQAAQTAEGSYDGRADAATPYQVFTQAGADTVQDIG